MTVDLLLLFAHLLLFVYWVGADLAVFYGAGFSADPKLSIEARQAIGKLTRWVDQFPRSAVPLIGAVGVTLAVRQGYLNIGASWIALVWLLAAVWITVNLYVYAHHDEPAATAAWQKFDQWFRIAIMLGTAAAAVTSLLHMGVTEHLWLAVKMLMFAVAILFSLAVRVLFRPFRPALERIVSGKGTPADTTIMKQSLARTRIAVVGIWSAAALAALMGLWKPM